VKQKSIIALTLLISVLLLSPTFLSLSAATSTFGQTSVGNNSAWQSAGVMVGSRFTSSGGTPVSMSVYIAQSSSSSNTAKCAIYSESNKQLIAVTEEKTIPAGYNGWMTFNFGSSPSLTSGSSYSLVVWFKNSASTVRYNSGNSAQTWYAIQSYTGNFPNGPYSSLGSYGQESNVYSIYCTLSSETSSPSPSPSPSPTSSPTQSTSSSTFGQTAQGNNAAWQPSNLMVGSRFTAPSTGTLNSIMVYLTNGASTSTNVKCAIYSETNKALVASSQELTISGRASGWFTFPTTTSPTIDAGQRYSLVVWLQSANCYLSYASGSSSQSWYTQASYGNLPSIYNINGQENNVYSLYATITPTGAGPQNPIPTQTPIPTNTPTTIIAPHSTTNGELYLWTGFWMSAGDNNAKRIANARDTNGVNIWIDAGNYGGPHLTSSLINYFHAHGVKVVNRLWSDGGNVPLNTILHSSDSFGHSRGSVDYQLSIGPEIDAFMIDECDQWNHASYYEAIANYVHSKGKLLFVNTGTHNVETRTCTYADKISTEFSWYQFINSPQHASLIAAYPQKFIGVTKDWMYDINFVYCPPRSASGDRPAYTAPLSLSRATWETKTAWAGGVFCMAATPADNGYLPTWWEQYVASLSW
jgi:hypothetical protein